jgi:hypothetical protein
MSAAAGRPEVVGQCQRRRSCKQSKSWGSEASGDALGQVLKTDSKGTSSTRTSWVTSRKLGAEPCAPRLSRRSGRGPTNFGRPPVSTMPIWMPFGTRQRKSYWPTERARIPRRMSRVVGLFDDGATFRWSLTSADAPRIVRAIRRAPARPDAGAISQRLDLAASP